MHGFFVSLVSRLAEKRAPKEVQKAKGSLEPGKENAFFSEKSHLCFRGWQDVDGKSTPFYNDLNLQKKAPELCRGIGADSFRIIMDNATKKYVKKSTNEFCCQHESDRICTACIILR